MCSLAPVPYMFTFLHVIFNAKPCFDPHAFPGRKHLGTGDQAHSHLSSPSSAVSHFLGLLLTPAACALEPALALRSPICIFALSFALVTLFCLVPSALTIMLFSLPVMKTSSSSGGEASCSVRLALRACSGAASSSFLSWTQAGLPPLPLLVELKRKDLQAHVYMLSSVSRRCVLFKSQDNGSTSNTT